MSSGERQCGFTYLTALLFVAASGLGLASVAESWSHARQREQEAELLWVGNQFRQAIALYYHRTPGSNKRYPPSLEDLVEDKRFASTQRYLRRIYADPVTGKPEWGLVPAPGGGIMGVHSMSQARPLKAVEFGGAARYADWRFTYLPP